MKYKILIIFLFLNFKIFCAKNIFALGAQAKHQTPAMIEQESLKKTIEINSNIQKIDIIKEKRSDGFLKSEDKIEVKTIEKEDKKTIQKEIEFDSLKTEDNDSVEFQILNQIKNMLLNPTDLNGQIEPERILLKYLSDPNFTIFQKDILQLISTFSTIKAVALELKMIKFNKIDQTTGKEDNLMNLKELEDRVKMSLIFCRNLVIPLWDVIYGKSGLLTLKKTDDLIKKDFIKLALNESKNAFDDISEIIETLIYIKNVAIDNNLLKNIDKNQNSINELKELLDSTMDRFSNIKIAFFEIFPDSKLENFEQNLILMMNAFSNIKKECFKKGQYLNNNLDTNIIKKIESEIILKINQPCAIFNKQILPSEYDSFQNLMYSFIVRVHAHNKLCEQMDILLNNQLTKNDFKFNHFLDEKIIFEATNYKIDNNDLNLLIDGSRKIFESINKEADDLEKEIKSWKIIAHKMILDSLDINNLTIKRVNIIFDESFQAYSLEIDKKIENNSIKIINLENLHNVENANNLKSDNSNLNEDNIIESFFNF